MTDKYAKYTYKHNDQTYGINPVLAERQNVSDDVLKNIIMFHRIRLRMHDYIEKTDDREKLRVINHSLVNLEFKLQDLWGFERNIDYYRFWYVPKCTCPKMDNDDNYPLGMYYRSKDCPLHGLE